MQKRICNTGNNGIHESVQDLKKKIQHRINTTTLTHVHLHGTSKLYGCNCMNHSTCPIGKWKINLIFIHLCVLPTVVVVVSCPLVLRLRMSTGQRLCSWRADQSEAALLTGRPIRGCVSDCTAGVFLNALCNERTRDWPSLKSKTDIKTNTKQMYDETAPPQGHQEKRQRHFSGVGLFRPGEGQNALFCLPGAPEERHVSRSSAQFPRNYLGTYDYCRRNVTVLR